MGKTTRPNRWSGEAARYARSYFDPVERSQMLEEAGCPICADYAVLLVNRFVPVRNMPDSAAIMRRFTSGAELSNVDKAAMKAFWAEVDSIQNELSTAFKSGSATPEVALAAQHAATWPAIGVAASEEEMRSILLAQFQVISRNGIQWQGVDSSTHTWRKPNGIYVSVEWFYHYY